MDKEINTILSALEIDALNEIQIAVQKSYKNNQDIILLAPTGSGKTLAFLLVVYQLIKLNEKYVQCLILEPTRELALQIEEVWRKMNTGFKVNVCYGGHALETEINNFSVPPALLIGTPGRICDHLRRKTFHKDSVQLLILDEFDQMLSFGFHDQMKEIIEQLPSVKQKILVSATTHDSIPEFVSLESAVLLDFKTNNEGSGQLSLKFVRSSKNKSETLILLLSYLQAEFTLIFCNHREIAEDICVQLNRNGYEAAFYHGGMDQTEREKAMIRFSNGSIHYLVATDIASRGLDIKGIQNIIHYQLPSKENEFIHRNGRTARMYASGKAYVLVDDPQKLPVYLSGDNPEQIIPPVFSTPSVPVYATLYISGGKKDKLNKTDIVGFFIQKGMLEKEDIHRIHIKDFSSFVAVKRSKIKPLLSAIKDQKMKGKKFKIEIMT